MRNIVLALLLANALYFAWQYYGQTEPAAPPSANGPARVLLNTGITLRSELIP